MVLDGTFYKTYEKGLLRNVAPKLKKKLIISNIN